MIRISCVQFEATIDEQANLKTVVDGIANAASHGSSLVTFPEASSYSDPAKVNKLGNDGLNLDGPWIGAVANAARRNRIGVLVGVREHSRNAGKPYNTLVYVDANGDTTLTYRKVHLYDAFSARESDSVSAGDTVPAIVFSIDDIVFGACTCYDLRFPEVFRYLVDQGTCAFLVPAAWRRGPCKEVHWHSLLRARAIENTCYCVGCGQTGPFNIGQSVVIDPMGVTVCGGGDEPGMITFELSKARVDAVRRTNPSLANRRFSVSFGAPQGTGAVD